MRIESPAFQDGALIPKQYTCDGENINPPLYFSDIPPEAKTLALIIEDPDVPKSIRSDGMWDHWVVWNIPAIETAIAAGTTVTGVYGVNSSGEEAYQGPCPPDTVHRYFFRLYALKDELSLKEGATKAKLLNAMQGHIIAEATLMGRYERSG